MASQLSQWVLAALYQQPKKMSNKKPPDLVRGFSRPFQATQVKGLFTISSIHPTL